MTATQLKRARKTLGLSQSALAQQLGIHRVTLAKMEGGDLDIPAMLDLAMRWIQHVHANLRIPNI